MDKDTTFSQPPIELDVRRMLCPIPVIKTQDTIKQLQSGDFLKVICTDPGALQDIPLWCKMNGHRIVCTKKEHYELVILIEVGAS